MFLHKEKLVLRDAIRQPQTKSKTSTLHIAYPGNTGKNVFASFSAYFVSIYINVSNSNNTGRSCP